MPIDEQTKAFLDKANAAPGPPPGSLPLEEFRAAVEPFRALGFDQERVAAVDDLEVPRDSGDSVVVRLYRPEGAAPLPVVVWVHGGSWVRVTVELLENHFRVIANRSGCAIAAVDYGLAPETRFPVQLQEVLAAARWLKDNADAFGLDPRRIGIGGESSGANMAAAVARLDRDSGGIGFAHQALVLPVLDATFTCPSWDRLGSGFLLTRAQLEWAVELYAPGVRRTDECLSPLHAASFDGLPPALVVTGEYDPLRDEGDAYAEALRRAGVPVEHRCVDGLIHHAMMAPKLLSRGREVVESTAAAVGRALGGVTAGTAS